MESFDVFQIIMEMLLVLVCVFRIRQSKQPVFFSVIGVCFAVAVVAKFAGIEAISQFAVTVGYLHFALLVISDMRWKYR
jgi:hypothetical protein